MKRRRRVTEMIDEKKLPEEAVVISMATRPRSRRSAVVKEPNLIIPATMAANCTHGDLVSSAAVPASFPPPSVNNGLPVQAEEKQVGQCSHTHEKQKHSSFGYVSKRKRRQNQIPDGSSVICLQSNQSGSDHGNHKDVKHLGKAISSPSKLAQKRRKKQKFVDTIDSGPYIPKLRVRGQSRGQNKMDSKNFDNILEIIWGGLSEEKRSSFACLNSMWFYWYTQEIYSKEKVLSWIMRENIFSKHYVFIPIVIWSHWSLLILCHFGEKLESKSKTPCMLLLDSMQRIGPERLEPHIRKFVFDIHRSAVHPVTDESIDRIPLLVPKVPQQKDGEECGRYVLYFINLFLENAPESFNVSEGYPYFMKEDWFSNEGLDNFWKRCSTIKMESHENEGKSKSEDMEDEDVVELTEGFV